VSSLVPPTPRLLLIGAAAFVALRLAVFTALAWGHGGLVTAMCQFDCFWYTRIGTEGYLSDTHWANLGAAPNWAFFPLFPLLLGALARVTGMSGQVAGMVLSNLFLVGLLLVGARYLRERGVAASPFLWFGFVLALPHTLFFSAVYTEALFALLSLGCLLALRLNLGLVAGFCAALASATRPQGILLAPIVAAYGLRALYARRAEGDFLRRLGDAALPLALAPLGLCAYVAAQYWITGDGLLFNHVQIHWRREWLGPLEWFRIGLMSWDWHRLPKEPTHSYETAWALAGLGMALWCAWCRRWAEAFFLAASILLPAASGLDSLPRYVATNPVFLASTFSLLARLPPRVLGFVVLPMLALAHVPLLLAWYRAWGAVF
jgi:hypothetical protein